MDSSFSDSDDDKSKEHVMGLGNITSDDDDDNMEDGNSDTDDTSDDEDLFQNNNKNTQFESDEDERLMGTKKSDYFGTDINDVVIHKNSKKNKFKKGTGAGISDLIQKESVKLREKQASQIIPSSYLNMVDEVKKSKHPKKESNKHMEENDSINEVVNDEMDDEKRAALNDYNVVMTELKNRLCPLIKARKESLLKTSATTEYLETRYFLSMNFMVNIGVYMMIKNSDSYHPKHLAVLRVKEFRDLREELNKAEWRFGPKLEKLLKDYKEGKLVKVEEPKKREVVRQKNVQSATESDEDNDNEDIKMNVDKVEKNDETRYITYKMSKNKGLMPSRKKEQRNPRVKYRKKYLDKLKRRKGQVREVRKELNRYDGEKTGIKAYLVRSRKMK